MAVGSGGWLAEGRFWSMRLRIGMQECSGRALLAYLLHWLLHHVLRFPDQCELRLLSHTLEVVGPQGQCLGCSSHSVWDPPTLSKPQEIPPSPS